MLRVKELQWRRGLVGMLALGLLNCAQIVGIEEGLPREAPPECLSVDDCQVGATECRPAMGCTQGVCVYEPAPLGTMIAEQKTGDCRVIVCDGDGKTSIVPAATDFEDDGNPCTADSCDSLTVVHTPVPQFDCYTGPTGTLGVGLCKAGTQQCDASGKPAGTCTGDVVPQEERCDMPSTDEDCDGMVNETGPEGGTCSCGDGVISTSLGEACDDGGTANTDTCSSTCSVQQVIDIKVGSAHACIRTSTLAVKCWGENAFGQLGVGSTLDIGDASNEMGGALMRSAIGAMDNVAELSLGLDFACARLTDMTMRCWGQNDRGQLSEGNTEARGDQFGEMGVDMPVVSMGTNVVPVSISSGRAHSCALLNSGDVKCWGSNGGGQLGQGDILDRGDEPSDLSKYLLPVNLGTGRTAKAVSAGNFHSCAILDNDSVKCWGTNSNGQLGLGDALARGDASNEMGDALPVVDLGVNRKAVAISAGTNFTCATLDNGGIKCWGLNDTGQLGLGDKMIRGNMTGQMGDALPYVNLGTGKTAKQVVASDGFACARFNDDTLKCWGVNAFGQLGQGDQLARGDEANELGDALPPIALGIGRSVMAFDLGTGFGCALLDDSTVKCWGAGASGRLGYGDVQNRGSMTNQMGDNLPTVKIFSDVW